MTTKAELKEQADKLKAELTELNNRIDKMDEAPEDWDKPPFNLGDKYYCVLSWADGTLDVWYGCSNDIKRWRQGNALHTKEEAELKAKKDRARARIQRHADYINKRDGREHSGFFLGEDNFCINGFDHREKYFYIGTGKVCQVTDGAYFSSMGTCKEHLKECEVDYKVLWGVK